MKKIVALAMLASISLSAHAEKMYGAIGLGTSDFGTAYTIAGGMEVARIPAGPKIVIPIDAEVGYINFGTKDTLGFKTSLSGFFGTAVGSYAINEDLSATARLGFATLTAKISGACAPFCGSSTSTETVHGAGIRYSLQKKTGIPLFVGAEYNNYGGEAFVSGRVALGF